MLEWNRKIANSRKKSILQHFLIRKTIFLLNCLKYVFECETFGTLQVYRYRCNSGCIPVIQRLVSHLFHAVEYFRHGLIDVLNQNTVKLHQIHEIKQTDLA